MTFTAPTFPQRCSCLFTSSPAYPTGGQVHEHTVYESNAPDLTVFATLCSTLHWFPENVFSLLFSSIKTDPTLMLSWRVRKYKSSARCIGRVQNVDFKDCNIINGLHHRYSWQRLRNTVPGRVGKYKRWAKTYNENNNKRVRYKMNTTTFTTNNTTLRCHLFGKPAHTVFTQ